MSVQIDGYPNLTLTEESGVHARIRFYDQYMFQYAKAQRPARVEEGWFKEYRLNETT